MKISVGKLLVVLVMLALFLALMAEAGRGRKGRGRGRSSEKHSAEKSKGRKLRGMRDRRNKGSKSTPTNVHRVMPHVKPHPGHKQRVDPERFLERFGYLGKRQEGVQHSPESRRQAIKNFQRMVSLKVSGLMDDQTRELMAAPRCGMADVQPESEAIKGVAREPSRAPSNYYAPGYKWSKTQLTWKTLNYSPDFYWGDQRSEITRAFKTWTDVTPLQIGESTANDVDIEIKFVRGEHGDGAGNAFDGPGGILAHAFYPETGDTHFDEDETWTKNSEQGYNLYQVAAHEFGHALGLGHSNVPGALMAPYYQGYDPSFKLPDDDIRAIQSLYGSSTPRTTPRPPVGPTTTPGPPTSPQPGSKPDSCTVKFGAVLQAHDYRIYVFNDRWVWRLNEYGLDEGYPTRLTKVYSGAPYNIGAAIFSYRTRYTYFFKGKKIWKFYGFELVERKTVKTAGYPEGPQAAVTTRDGRIYLLRTSSYWVFDEDTMDVAEKQGRPMTEVFPGVTPNQEAAVKLRDGYMYFFKGSRYRKYDEENKRVISGYPKDKAAPWMGRICGGSDVPK